jgi:hypothetical protein
MLPSWIIEEMARERREREAREERERARLWIEEPVHDRRDDRPESEPGRSLVVEIQIA